MNHPGLRERLVAELRNRGCAFHEIALDPNSPLGIVDQIESAIGADRPPAIFVYGLESMFDLRVRQNHAMDMLNMNRNYFVKRFPLPVVFWVPEFGMRELARQTPDFWSGRSGTYSFAGESGDAAETIERLRPGFDWNLSPKERKERREILAHLLGELDESAPAWAGVNLMAAHAAEFESDHKEAEQRLLLALEASRKSNDLGVQANALKSLGDVALSQARYSEGEQLYQQALPVYRQIGDRLGEANALKSLGDVALQQARYPEAAQLYQQALPVYRQIGDRLGEANALKSLGDVARMQARYAEAEQLYQQALPLYRQIRDRPGEAGTLWSQGRLALARNDEPSAAIALAEAARIYSEIGREDLAGQARQQIPATP
ncbi:MAG: tetratricopeptide repeat protein [Acidobacteria bacterium]|nr:tetratricopeptide repeat protein [Acidobacteriota bacterium]